MGHSRVVETFQGVILCKFSYEGEEDSIGAVLRSERCDPEWETGEEEKRRGAVVPEAHFEKRTPHLGFRCSHLVQNFLSKMLWLFFSQYKKFCKQ